MIEDLVKHLLTRFADVIGIDPFLIKGILAVLFVCLLCGAVGSLVVGSRMAFFSDAMSHCAFAGVALGYLMFVLSGYWRDDPTIERLVPIVMGVFGASVGIAIAYVRENSTLDNDTVIGVFFALAIGSGTMFFTVLKQISTFDPDGFLFGSPLFIPEADFVYLMVLQLTTVALFYSRYNDMVFGSLSTSLARTRRVPIRANNYLLVILLALVVNFSIKAVGVLLINALLVVPAATAMNIAPNLRRMFWYTISLCVLSGLVGVSLSYFIELPVGRGRFVKFGPSGTIVVVSVIIFFISLSYTVLFRRDTYLSNTLRDPTDPQVARDV